MGKAAKGGTIYVIKQVESTAATAFQGALKSRFSRDGGRGLQDFLLRK